MNDPSTTWTVFLFGIHLVFFFFLAAVLTAIAIAARLVESPEARRRALGVIRWTVGPPLVAAVVVLAGVGAFLSACIARRQWVENCGFVVVAGIGILWEMSRTARRWWRCT